MTNLVARFHCPLSDISEPAPPRGSSTHSPACISIEIDSDIGGMYLKHDKTTRNSSSGLRCDSSDPCGSD
ncbi:hypothetical protein BGY98DRAFT_972475 [Russula aff. rugulosa BPL654]|nr:hypothetical protein BGY98DRAFT_1047037 [Russula aff. rugulosa BPL654]KAI0278803.1 hypothetical protein BGY98DRAFT_972475 [Russula aff. rugulosa BPL654]